MHTISRAYGGAIYSTLVNNFGVDKQGRSDFIEKVCGEKGAARCQLKGSLDGSTFHNDGDGWYVSCTTSGPSAVSMIEKTNSELANLLRTAMEPEV